MKRIIKKAQTPVFAILMVLGILLSSAYLGNTAYASDGYTTTISGELKVDNEFNRPFTPADGEAGDYWDVYYADDMDGTWEETNNYFTRTFIPSISGNYTFEAISAEFETTDYPDDTFVIIYDGAFNPLYPLNNLYAANDDHAINDSLLSYLPEIPLIGKHAYTLVLTSYESGVTGPLTLEICGPGSVSVSTNQYSSDATVEAEPTLASLTFSDNTLKTDELLPEFTSDNTEYRAVFNVGHNKFSIEPIASSPGAYVEVYIGEYPSGDYVEIEDANVDGIFDIDFGLYMDPDTIEDINNNFNITVALFSENSNYELDYIIKSPLSIAAADDTLMNLAVDEDYVGKIDYGMSKWFTYADEPGMTDFAGFFNVSSEGEHGDLIQLVPALAENAVSYKLFDYSNRDGIGTDERASGINNQPFEVELDRTYALVLYDSNDEAVAQYGIDIYIEDRALEMDEASIWFVNTASQSMSIPAEGQTAYIQMTGDYGEEDYNLDQYWISIARPSFEWTMEAVEQDGATDGMEIDTDTGLITITHDAIPGLYKVTGETSRDGEEESAFRYFVINEAGKYSLIGQKWDSSDADIYTTGDDLAIGSIPLYDSSVFYITNIEPDAEFVLHMNGSGYEDYSQEIHMHESKVLYFQRTPLSNDGGQGDDETTSSGATSGGMTTGVDVLINGEKVNAGTQTTTNDGGQSTTTIEVHPDLIKQQLDSAGDHAVVTIPVNTNSAVVIGELNGQMIKDMDNKLATIQVKSDTFSYTLPADQINIDAISAQLGTNVTLSGIQVQIQISQSTAQTVQVTENAAAKGEFAIIAPPLDFTVTCTYNNQTVTVGNFNVYVERTIAIPDGVDPNKITTGIVVEPDGTVRHVPTRITVIDGKYYAVINSLTNSTYSVVWHPIEFADVTNNWAKEAINNMGSRMVVSGVDSNNYEPGRDITRAEFAAIIVRALGLKPGQGTNPYADVDNAAWYADYIRTATDYKIIRGYDNGNFGPTDMITREQAMTMIARAMTITGLKIDLTNDEVPKLLAGFKDGSACADYAERSIAACVKSGVITGRNDSKLAPKANITRAEVAVIMERLLQKSSLI